MRYSIVLCRTEKRIGNQIITPPRATSPSALYRFAAALRHNCWPFFDALCITLLAYLLSVLLIQPFSLSTGSLMSGVDRRDFNMTDFYNIVADARPVSDLDTSVVVVDIAFTDRSDVTDVMELLGDLNPRAVGLDVTFNESKPDDERLLSALARIPNLVMAVGLSSNGPSSNNQFVPDDYSYFYNQECDTHGHGAVNLPSKYDGATIRQFQVAYPLVGGDTLPSMALALARLVDPKAAAKILERGNRMETIDYPCREFDIIPWFELPENAEKVNGKIVLVGAIGELGDTHATPVEEKMAGVLIHAYAISTILRANYYRVASPWLTIGVSMLLCFLLCIVNIAMPLIGIKGLVLRIVQLVGLYLIARVGYWLFIDYHFVFDFSYTLLMFAFGFFATDIWNGLVYLIKKLIIKLK